MAKTKQNCMQILWSIEGSCESDLDTSIVHLLMSLHKNVY